MTGVLCPHVQLDARHFSRRAAVSDPLPGAITVADQPSHVARFDCVVSTSSHHRRCAEVATGLCVMRWRVCGQVYNRVRVEYLPVYQPSEAEVHDAELFATNVREAMLTHSKRHRSERSNYDKLYGAAGGRSLSLWRGVGCGGVGAHRVVRD